MSVMEIYRQMTNALGTGLESLVGRETRMLWLRRSVTNCLLIVLCLSAYAAEQPSPVTRISLASVIGSLSSDEYSNIEFLTDRLLLISHGEARPRSVLYDTQEHKVLRTVATCGTAARNVHATFEGNILAACASEVVLYDQQFNPVSRFEIPTGAYDLLLSPTRRVVAVNPLPRRGAASVLTTANFTKIANFPSESGYVIAVFTGGYLVYESTKDKEGWELLFHGFHESHPQSIAKSNKNCAQVGFGISETEFLKLACGKDDAGNIDLATGKVKMAFADASPADLAQSAFSGDRFVLGSLGYSKMHVVKQRINPLTYIEALGTCCDDPGNLRNVRLFDQQSGRLLTELHWKTTKKDSVRDQYDTTAVSLSPSGQYLAIRRGMDIEIYKFENALTK